MSESLRYVGDATPYTYIGDSHAGVGTFLIEDPATGERLVTRTCGIWRFIAANVLDEDRLIGDELMQVLRRLGAFHSGPSLPPITGLRPVFTIYGNKKVREELALTSFANDQPFVLCVGEIDLRYILYRFAEDEIDFQVPFDASGLEILPAYQSKQTLKADKMLVSLGEYFQPLFVGLRILYNAGLKSLFLHCLPPPAVDDNEAERVYKSPSPARLRYKIAMYINYLYEAVCRDIGIGFVNTWPLVTANDLLRPEFSLDGLHLNRKHAILSVQEVHRQFAGLRAPA